ncbi:MAG: hypothetical protein RL244_480 [Pseudomonadota bacterium]|jgi:uncharacterized membrane-anchored protein
MSTVVDTDSEQVLQVAGPLQLPPRTHAELHDELHARPPLRTTACCVVSYWAQAGLPAEVAEAALRVACADAGQPAPQAGARHHLIETGGWALKYERHGEFVSWQLRLDLPADPRQEPELLLGAMLRADARHALSPAFFTVLGEHPMLAATHVVVWPVEEDGMLRQARRVMAQLLAATRSDDDTSHNLLGSWIADERAAVFTHLLLDDAGFTRFLLLDVQLSEQQRAREVQRIVEIEGYRALAMLGFPLAHQESAQLGVLERRLLQAVDQFAGQGHQAGESEQQLQDRRLFAELVAIASEVEHGVARSRYRFSATRAYHRIVARRLQDLRESRIQGLQTLGGFLSRRFTPAMEFCESTDARLSDVAQRVQRVVELIKVRVETRREDDNQEVLQALGRRQHLQLRLQQTVEGLSVVAISYYAVSLLSYVFKLLKTVPAIEALHIPVEAAVGASVIPVVLMVAWFVRRIRQHHSVD